MADLGGAEAMSFIELIKHVWGPHEDWRSYELFPFIKVKDVHGNWIEGPVMARCINGQWQYQDMTEADEKDWMRRRSGW